MKIENNERLEMNNLFRIFHSVKGAIYTSSQNPDRVMNISMQAAFAKDYVEVATSP